MSRSDDFWKKIRADAERQFKLSTVDEIELYLAWGALKRKVIPQMLVILRNFFWDETSFIRYSRAICAALGMALHAGVIPHFDGPMSWWIGPAIVALAFMFGAGDKTPSPEELQRALDALQHEQERRGEPMTPVMTPVDNSPKP